jgi:hypothetical protein
LKKQNLHIQLLFLSLLAFYYLPAELFHELSGHHEHFCSNHATQSVERQHDHCGFPVFNIDSFDELSHNYNFSSAAEFSLLVVTNYLSDYFIILKSLFNKGPPLSIIF